MQSKQFTFRGATIHYEVGGSGEPVILVHGFAECGGIWQYQRSFLKPHYRLLVPDLPGSGKSEGLLLAGTEVNTAIEWYAKCIKQMLDIENIGQCTILGHSMGGYVALSFAEQFPSRLKALGLIHSTAFADGEQKKELRQKGISFIQKFGSQEFLKQSIPNLFGEKFTRDHPEEISALLTAADDFRAADLIQYYTGMMYRPDRTEVLKNIPVPVLFIMGEEDKSVSLKDGLKQCWLPSRVLINILPETAHMGMWEKKDQVNDTLMEFLKYVSDA